MAAQYLVLADEDFGRKVDLSRVDIVCFSEADGLATGIVQAGASQKVYVLKVDKVYVPKDQQREPEFVYVDRVR